MSIPPNSELVHNDDTGVRGDSGGPGPGDADVPWSQPYHQTSAVQWYQAHRETIQNLPANSTTFVFYYRVSMKNVPSKNYCIRYIFLRQTVHIKH